MLHFKLDCIINILYPDNLDKTVCTCLKAQIRASSTVNVSESPVWAAMKADVWWSNGMESYLNPTFSRSSVCWREVWCQRIQMTFSEFVSVTHIDGSLKGIPISGSFEQTCFSVDLCPEV